MIAFDSPIPVRFAGVTRAGQVPSWASRWDAQGSSVDELNQSPALAGVLVLSSTPEEIQRESARLAALSQTVLTASHPVRVVLTFAEGGHSEAQLVDVFQAFRPLISRLEVADGQETLEQSLIEAVAKYRVEDAQLFPDPLAEAHEVRRLADSLCSPRGRLDAKLIASTLGIPWTRFAVLLGSNKQAVGKTPDAAGLQQKLRIYARICRLQAVLPGQGFLAWMQRPNLHLDDHSPLQIIQRGQPEIVSDLVEAMLTGTPS